MADSLSFDEIPNDFFNMLDDFPLEGIEVGSDDWDSMQFLDLPTNMQFPGLFGELQNDFTKENKNLSVSYDETCRQNQFRSSAETTSSGGALLSDDSSDAKPAHFFKTSSPVSILESTGSFFAENPKTASAGGIPAKRARTKRSRSRPSTFDRLRALPLIWSTTTKTSCPSSSEPAKRTLLKKKNKSMKKRAWPEFSREAAGDPAPAVGKKCTHCEVTSTPQWREGPMGPKTLCNACGVRYRSGRLFPEYRPAASPTFVPAVHSNSHKKVVEMRNKASSSSSNNNYNNNNSGRVGLKLYYRSQPGKSVMQLIV